jgi:hypothetical protein
MSRPEKSFEFMMVLTRLKVTYPVKDGDQSIDFTDLDITAIALQKHFLITIIFINISIHN